MSIKALNLTWVATGSQRCETKRGVSFGLVVNKTCCRTLNHLKGFDRGGWEARE